MKYMHRAARGFTIVELATVILIISILAMISIGAYNGVQGRARDSSRVSDMNNLAKALDIYKSRNGEYPPRASAAADWAYSNEHPTTYIENLTGSGQVLNTLPKDPVNNSTYRYAYYVYNAGQWGCDANLGRFYVLVIPRMEAVPAGSQHKASPGFVCSSRNWSDDWGGAAWVQGGYVNG